MIWRLSKSPVGLQWLCELLEHAFRTEFTRLTLKTFQLSDAAVPMTDSYTPLKGVKAFLFSF